ncbi:MAG: DUF202 domain-containing protein [Microbacterium sp.]
MMSDRGAQAERTELAWRRSALAVGVGSLIALRLLPELIGGAGAAIGCLGLCAATLIWATGQYRSRAFARHLADPHVRAPGGALLLALVAFTIAVGGFSLALTFIAAR